MGSNDFLDVMQELVAFVRVAEAGSFSAAARAQGVTPSAISHQVARLEAFLGIRLLDRTTAGVRLTPEGERYLQRVGGALGALKAATRDARQGVRRSLYVHTSPSLASPAGFRIAPAHFVERHGLRCRLQHQIAVDHGKGGLVSALLGKGGAQRTDHRIGCDGESGMRACESVDLLERLPGGVEAWLSPPPPRTVSERPHVLICEGLADPTVCDWLIDRANRREMTFTELADSLERDVGAPYAESFEHLARVHLDADAPSAAMLERLRAYAAARHEAARHLVEALRERASTPARDAAPAGATPH